MWQRSRKETSSDMRDAVRSVRKWFIAIGVFSAGVNLLMLTGVLYMMQVYDRVLLSQSIPTLIALSLLALLAFLAQGLLEAVRGRMLVHVGASYEEKLAPAVFNSVSGLAVRGFSSAQAAQPSRDLERIRSFLSSMGPTAILDMPFMPLFLAGCFLIHPWLGWLAVAGGSLIIFFTLIMNTLSTSLNADTVSLTQKRNTMLEACRRNAEAMVAMGFRRSLRDRWNDTSQTAVAALAKTNGRSAVVASWAKVLRLALQSSMIGLGGYLAVHQEISAGAIIAASVMMSRALAPVELAIGHWRNFVGARESHKRLSNLLSAGALIRGETSLPAPNALLSVDNLFVIPPGAQEPVLHGISLELPAGSAMAVFGPSAAGKSSLARALVGVWSPRKGSVRLDGADIAHYPEDEIGDHIGYLPQDVELFDGTVTENIARFDTSATAAEIVEAAQMAGAHDTILSLPEGYDTKIGEGGARLSGGQRQRVALGRALFRKPFLVVLDEPNSNLDGSGDKALNAAIGAIRDYRGIAIVISHRTATMEAVDHIAIMDQGRLVDFGTKEEMMPRLVRPARADAVAKPQKLAVMVDERPSPTEHEIANES